MDIIALFPQAVTRQEVALTDIQREYLLTESVKDRANIGNRTSKNDTILEHVIMSDFKQKMIESINAHFHEIIAPRERVELYITQSWLNVTRKGEFHHKHTHPGSVLSGVYYVLTGDDDRIVFSQQGHKTLDWPTEKFNQFNSPTWWLPAKAGELLCFASSLEHHVPTVETEHLRISIAFNTWFSGTCGSAGDMTLLQLPMGDMSEVG